MQDEITYATNEDDEGSCLFLTRYRIVRAYCPFKVVCMVAVDSIKLGDIVVVEEVLRGSPCTIMYYIRDRYYPHYHFYYKPPSNMVITRLK